MIAQISTARGRSALAVSAVFAALATIFVALRIYTRAVLIKQMGADDYAILIALAFSWAFFGLFAGETYHGMGAHLVTIPHPIYITQMICFWASIPIYQMSLITTKMSILLQYRRLFSTTPHMRLVCLILIWFLTDCGTWTIVSSWATCLPIAKFWNPDMPGFCLNKEGVWFSSSAIHILTDLLILIYPMPVLHSLQLPKKQKAIVMGIFALGGFVMIISILRLSSILVFSKSTNPTYVNVNAATWSAVECNVAIICACLPGTRAFFSRLYPHIFSTNSGDYKGKTVKLSLTGRTGNLTYTTTLVQAAVVGGHHIFEYDFGDLSPSGSSHSSMNESESKKGLTGIKATMFMTQESTSNTATITNEKDSDSMRGLVDNCSTNSF